MRRLLSIFMAILFTLTFTLTPVLAALSPEGNPIVQRLEPITAEEAAAGLLAADGDTIVMYVAPNGNDVSASGTIEDPFASLTRARDVVREMLKSADRPIEVLLRGGKYFMAEPVVFSPEDSGTPEAPVAYRAYPDEAPVLSGAKTLEPDNWQVYSGGIMVADVEAGLGVDELFINGRRQTLARYPNYNADQPLQGSTSQADIKARSANWADPAGGYIRAIHQNAWGGNSFIITGKNAGNALGLNYTWVGDNNRGAGIQNGSQSVMVENILEEVDSEGEWYYDDEAGKLYLYPEAGTDLAAAEIEGAVTSEILKFVGAKNGAIVQNITFDGVEISKTKRTLFTGDYVPLMRGDWCVVRAGAVFMQDAENLSLVNSTLRDVGGNAIFLSGHNAGHLIDNNEILDIGSTGILIAGLPESCREPSFWNVNVRDGKPMPETEPYYVHKTSIEDAAPGPAAEHYVKDVTISKNHIMNLGIYEKQSCGVSISVAHNIKVLQNTIHKSPRAGININDGTFGGHEIAYNDVFECQTETSDHGQFNSWGRDRFWSLGGFDTSGNRGADKYPVSQLDAMDTVKLHDNRWHHDGAQHSFGIDLDDGSTNFEIYNNLCLNVGIKLREGFSRKVYNNIIIAGEFNLHCTFEDSHDDIQSNIVLRTNPYALAGGAGESRFKVSQNVIDKNWFYDFGVQQNYPGGYWRNLGFDVNSINEDPFFLDTASNDYTVTNQAAMETVGFVNFPMAQFGKPGCEYQSPVFEKTSSDGGETVDRVMRENWLGATVTAVHSQAILTATGTTDFNGVYFEEVPEDSLAAAYGYKVNDIIKYVNGQKLGYKDTFAPIYDAIPTGGLAGMGIVRDQLHITINYLKGEQAVWVNDNDPAIAYSQSPSGWTYTGKASHTTDSYEGDLHYNQKGAAKDTWFEYDFTGSQVAYYTRTEDNMGDVKIILTTPEGELLDEKVVDCTSKNRTSKALVYTSPALPNGSYRLRVEKVDGEYFILDALKVTQSDPSVPLITTGPVTVKQGDSLVEELTDGQQLTITVPVQNQSQDYTLEAQAVVALYEAKGTKRLERLDAQDVKLGPGEQENYSFDLSIPQGATGKQMSVYLYTGKGQSILLPHSIKGASAVVEPVSFVPSSSEIELSYRKEADRATVAATGFSPNTQAILRVEGPDGALAFDQAATDGTGGAAFCFAVAENFRGEIQVTICDERNIAKQGTLYLDTVDPPVDAAHLKSLLAQAEQYFPNAGDYAFTGWRQLLTAYYTGQAGLENNLGQSEIDDFAIALEAALEQLAPNVENSSITGASDRFKIYRADGTPDGGNTDAGEDDRWQRRATQVDTKYPGCYAEIEGNFLSFELFGANKSDSTNSLKVTITCMEDICNQEEAKALSNNQSGTVSLYKKEGLCGGQHVIRFTNNDTRTNRYMELHRLEFTTAADPVPAVASISLASPPEKTDNPLGEELILAGGKLGVTYEDGTQQDLPLVRGMVAGFNKDIPGAQAVDIEYGGFTLKSAFTVMVKSEADTAELEALVEELSALELAEDDYTTASWADYAAALAAAQEVLAKAEPTADEVQTAYNALMTGWQGLVLKATGTMDMLALFVEVLGRLEESAFTPESWPSFKATLDTARQLVERNNSGEEEVLAALNALLDAQDRLVPEKAGALRQLVAEAEKLLENPEKYYSGSVEKLQQALDAARKLLKTPAEELEQADVDAAAMLLVDAITTLFEKGDITTLQTLVRYAKLLQEKNYTASSWGAFAATLQTAEEKLAENDMLPEEVTGQYNALHAAIGQLVPKANRNGLVTAIALAESILANRGQYIASTLEGLEAELAKANAVNDNDDATQAEVDEAIGRLMAQTLKVRKPANKAALKAGLGYAALTSGMNQAALEEAERLLADPDVTQEAVDKALAGLQSTEKAPSDAAAPEKAQPVAPDGRQRESISAPAVETERQSPLAKLPAEDAPTPKLENQPAATPAAPAEEAAPIPEGQNAAIAPGAENIPLHSPLPWAGILSGVGVLVLASTLHQMKKRKQNK